MGLSAYVSGVSVKTAYLPTLHYRPGGKPSLLAQWLKPEILVYPKDGGSPYVSAPYGLPGPSRWPTVGLVMGVVLFGVVALAVVGAARIAGH